MKIISLVHHKRLQSGIGRGVLLMVLLGGYGLAIAADKASGKQLYHGLGCVACHGDRGGSKLNEYPSLAGRSATFVASELNKYRNAIRKDPTMNAMAAGLSDKDIEDIAAYISGK